MTAGIAKEGLCWTFGAAMASSNNGGASHSRSEANIGIHNLLRTIETLQLKTPIGVFPARLAVRTGLSKLHCDFMVAAFIDLDQFAVGKVA